MLLLKSSYDTNQDRSLLIYYLILSSHALVPTQIRGGGFRRIITRTRQLS